MMNIRVGSRSKSIIAFFALTFAISWSVWVPLAVWQVDHALYKLGAFGPTLAALTLIILEDGVAGLKGLWRKLTLWRVSIRWYLFAFLSAVPIVLAAIWLDVWLGGPKPQFNDPSQLYLILPAFLYVLFTSVVGEEIGWRGYALPRLLQNSPDMVAAVLLGLIWGVWHIPLFLMSGNFHTQIPLLPFILQTVTFSIVYTWMYRNTQGSLLLPHLFHAASNTTLGVLPVLPMDTGGNVRPMWLAIVMWVVVTAIIVCLSGGRLEKKTRKGVDTPDGKAPGGGSGEVETRELAEGRMMRKRS